MKIGSTTVSDLQELLNEGARAVGTVGAQASVIVDGQRADLVYGTANAELDIPMTVDAGYYTAILA